MFDTSGLVWTRPPRDYRVTETEITVTTEPHTDLWQRTYYGFRNDNAPVLQMETEEEFFSFLEKRRGRLEGVCISGGEPTLSPALPDFIRRIRSLGYAVKLDTNGLSPDMLEGLLREGLVDYVAMDIKSSREGYAKASGVPDIDLTKIEKSAALLMKSDTPYEFRTTVVRELHDEGDMVRIGEWLSGAKNYFLQSFLDSGELISDGLHGYDKKGMEHLLKLLKVKIPSAKIRG